LSKPIEYLKILNETHATIWEEAKRLLDDVAAQKRELSAEENQQWGRYNERLEEIDQQIRGLVAADERENHAAIGREAMERQFGSVQAERMDRTGDQRLADWAKGIDTTPYGRDDIDKRTKGFFEIPLAQAAKEAEIIRRGGGADEVRALAWDTGSIASGVPTTTARELYQLMTAPISMFALPTYKFFTGSGEQMKFPRVNAHGIATQVIGQGTALAGTDATFLSMTLDAFKYGQLYAVSNEVLTDTLFDVAGFLGANIARAIGQVIDTDLVVGSGSGHPNGAMTAVATGANGTIATGGTLIGPTYETLVDMVYGVNANYRNSGNAAFLMRDLTAAAVRKLRDGAGGTVGAVLWEPSLTQGIQGQEPGLLLGYPVFTDPNVASMASNAKIAMFGDWSAYYLRQIGSLVIERDESVYFATDQVAFRGKWRVDGDIIDLTALVQLKQSV